LFNGTVDFDPGFGTVNLTSAGVGDIFVSKLDSIGNYKWAVKFGSTNVDYGFCVVSDIESALYTTGYFRNMVDFDPNGGVHNLTAVNTSGFLLKMNQCLNSFSTQIKKACSEYIWHGVTYTQTGIYTDTIPNAVGCDSIMTLDLIVWQINDSISLSGNTLTAVQNGAVYQWINCDSGYTAISGETNQSFTPSATGNYAVTITDNTNGCVDTSDCQFVGSIGLDEIKKSDSIYIVPNPSDGKFKIIVSKPFNLLSYKIVDLTGKMILHAENQTAKIISVDISDKAKGIYFLDIEVNHACHAYKISKE
jgi:hypothetical protein